MTLLVLTPTLGRSPFLAATVAAVAALPVRKEHLLIAPSERREELMLAFPGCGVIAEPAGGGGMYAALNAGLAAARGAWTWCTYLNDDDLPGNDFARRAVQWLEAGDARSVVYGDVAWIDEAGQRLGLISVEKNPAHFVALLQQGISPLSQPGMLFSRAVVDALGGFDPEWRWCGDLDFWLRAHRAGFAFVYQAGEAARFRLRSGQLSGEVGAMRREAAAITRRHFPVKVGGWARGVARWQFRVRNSVRVLARIRRRGWRRSETLLSGAASARGRGRVAVNGLGCFESGARAVLRELLRHYPADGPRAVVFMPACNRDDLRELPPQVRVIACNHALVGRWLRPVYELLLGLAARAGVFASVINLSHYGWCLGGRYVLYFHNALLLEPEGNWSGSGGRPNAFKRWCLASCLQRASLIVVQTEPTAARLKAYAEARGIVPAPFTVALPWPDVPSETATQSGAAGAGGAMEQALAEVAEQSFQFFYPCSHFPHKRAALAVAGVVAARKEDPRIELLLTLPAPAEDVSAVAGVQFVGVLSKEAVRQTYENADALLFTSASESLGLPLLEALSHGLPAVLPDLPYARAIYGDAGCYFTGEPAADRVAAALLRCVREADAWRRAVAARADVMRARSRTWAEHWSIFGLDGADVAPRLNRLRTDEQEQHAQPLEPPA